MLKTVKVKKNLRLDELIKYVWDNNEIFKGRTHIKFTSNSSCTVIFGVYGHFETDYGHDADDTFTVEAEEEITEDTEFEWLVRTYGVAIPSNIDVYHKKTISEIKGHGGNLIYALINERLELVWEAESDEL